MTNSIESSPQLQDLSLERADLSAVDLIQEILDASPRYRMNTEGDLTYAQDGHETLTALPPGYSPSQKHVFILRYSDIPVGVVDIIHGYPDPKTTLIGLLLIREDVQDKGLGRKFYETIEQWISNYLSAERIRLAVVDSNPVLPFWEKLGFSLTSEVKSHTGRNLTSIKRVMEKRL